MVTLHIPLSLSDDLKNYDPQKIETLIINCKNLSNGEYDFIAKCTNLHSITMYHHHNLTNLSSYDKLEKYLSITWGRGNGIREISFDEIDIVHALPNIQVIQYFLILPIMRFCCDYCECFPCKGHYLVYHKSAFEFKIDNYSKYRKIFLICDHDSDHKLIENCTELKNKYNNRFDQPPDYIINKLKSIK